MAKDTEKQEQGKEVEVRKGQDIERAASSRALSPFEEMEQLFERMNHLFGGFFPRRWMQPYEGEWPSWSRLAAPFEGRMPRVDVIDRDDEVVVRAELPGVDKKDLDVSITDNTVIIKGTTSQETKEEKGDYYRSETARGSFSRTLMLPAGVEGDKAKATFKDGILELNLPKAETAKRRKIEVK